MSADEARIKALAEKYEQLKQRQQELLEQLGALQQEMGEIMLQIIDVTRE
jgi:hypothetical protein